MPFSTAGMVRWYRAAEDVVHELEVASARERSALDFAVPELAVSARLLLVRPWASVATVMVSQVGNPRRLEELTSTPKRRFQFGYRDLGVELSLPGEQQLVRLRGQRVYPV